MAGEPFWQQVAFWTAAAGLLWNSVNSARTEYLQRKNRRNSIKLDEFRSQIRAPLTTVLTAVGQHRLGVKAHCASAKPPKEIRNDLVQLNSEMVKLLGQLDDALARANESKFANGVDWLENFGTLEDECLIASDRAMSPGRPENDLKPAIIDLAGRLEKIEKATYSRIEKETTHYLR